MRTWIVCLSACATVCAQTIIDGDFENGLNGWFSTGQPEVVYDVSLGSSVVDLNNAVQYGFDDVSQFVMTESREYTLTLDAMSPQSAPFEVWYWNPDKPAADALALLWTETLTPTWANYEFTFTAGQGRSQLFWQNKTFDPNAHVYFDNIGMSTSAPNIPEPVSASVLGLGLIAATLIRRRK